MNDQVASISSHVSSIDLGPHKLNGVPLRRVNQIYVIGTSTKLDLSSANFDQLDDKFLKRVRPAKKNAEKDIFETKKEVKGRIQWSKIDDFSPCRRPHSVKNDAKLSVKLMRPFSQPSKLMPIPVSFVVI